MDDKKEQQLVNDGVYFDLKRTEVIEIPNPDPNHTFDPCLIRNWGNGVKDGDNRKRLISEVLDAKVTELIKRLQLDPKNVISRLTTKLVIMKANETTVQITLFDLMEVIFAGTPADINHQLSLYDSHGVVATKDNKVVAIVSNDKALGFKRAHSSTTLTSSNDPSVFYSSPTSLTLTVPSEEGDEPELLSYTYTSGFQTATKFFAAKFMTSKVGYDGEHTTVPKKYKLLTVANQDNDLLPVSILDAEFTFYFNQGEIEVVAPSGISVKACYKVRETYYKQLLPYLKKLAQAEFYRYLNGRDLDDHIRAYEGLVALKLSYKLLQVKPRQDRVEFFATGLKPAVFAYL